MITCCSKVKNLQLKGDVCTDCRLSYRRAPPGKCNIKPSPVKINGKLINFYPKEGEKNHPTEQNTTLKKKKNPKLFSTFYCDTIAEFVINKKPTTTAVPTTTTTRKTTTTTKAPAKRKKPFVIVKAPLPTRKPSRKATRPPPTTAVRGTTATPPPTTTMRTTGAATYRKTTSKRPQTVTRATTLPTTPKRTTVLATTVEAPLMAATGRPTGAPSYRTSPTDPPNSGSAPKQGTKASFRTEFNPTVDTSVRGGATTATAGPLHLLYRLLLLLLVAFVIAC